MSNQYLEMKYHPAKKEVQFKRFQNGKEIIIRKDSCLYQFINKKGNFVLQNYGNDFFEVIKKAFDGLGEVEIKVITTKLDYEDFVQMVEFYNEGSSDFKITTKLIDVLPDMREVSKSVRDYGKKVINILREEKFSLFNISNNLEKDVAEAAQHFVDDIEHFAEDISDSLDKLDEPNVNLCFTGTYSTGKSTLINAILGYKILPESIDSKTAKMFKISSPREDGNVSINFRISNILTQLVWSGNKVEFTNNPTENDLVREIQNKINASDFKEKKVHEQINELLEILNDKIEVSSIIHIVFPIPLDSSSIKFTIFDTPGTDSNYEEHKLILEEALEQQNQSILIYVNSGDKLEGEGNNLLLSKLKKIEENNSKTSIDISRSLFVINKADTLKRDDRKLLRTKEIKSKDDDFTIKLSNKKLFFVSAKDAYAAKAVLNNVAEEDDVYDVEELSPISMSSEKYAKGFCFRENKCATSEYATKIMLQKSEDEYKKAKEKGSNADILLVTSGLFALENEIKTYGEKFSSAVQAYSVINSVEKSLNKITDLAAQALNANTEDINNIENAKKEIESKIDQSIDSESNRFIIRDDIPLNVLQILHLDKQSILGFENCIEKIIDSKLKKWFFGIAGNVIASDKQKSDLIKLITDTLNDFKNFYIRSRKEVLDKKFDEFKNVVLQAIEDNGKVSETAKNYILAIDPPKIEPPKLKRIEEEYDCYKIDKKILGWKISHLDKNHFMEEVINDLTLLLEHVVYEYNKDYKETLNSLVIKISSEFKSRIDNYCDTVKAMNENKKAMISLGEKLKHIAEDLSKEQNKLNHLIWSEQEENE